MQFINLAISNKMGSLRSKLSSTHAVELSFSVNKNKLTEICFPPPWSHPPGGGVGVGAENNKMGPMQGLHLLYLFNNINGYKKKMVEQRWITDGLFLYKK